MDRIRRPVKLGVIAHYAVLVLFIIGVLFPIGFIFMNTFKPTATIFTGAKKLAAVAKYVADPPRPFSISQPSRLTTTW